MNKELFLKISEAIGEQDLEDFSYNHEEKKYGFRVTDYDDWTDEGKYQYKTDKGILIEMDCNYKEINSYNFGVSISVSRSGSYYSDYYYDYDQVEVYEIKEEVIPEVIIPEHTELKWEKIMEVI